MQKFIENATKSPTYVFGTMIPPGEGKLVEVPDDGSGAAVAPSVPSIDEDVLVLLELSIAKITPQIPGFKHEVLDRILELEGGEGGKGRKGVLDAVAAERLTRANHAMEEAEIQKHADSLAEAELNLEAAIAALGNLADDAPEAERTHAQQACEAAQAAVDALKKPAE